MVQQMHVQTTMKSVSVLSQLAQSSSTEEPMMMMVMVLVVVVSSRLQLAYWPLRSSRDSLRVAGRRVSKAEASRYI
jgi:hypothetical protein